MSLADQMWGWVKATQQDRATLAPPRPEDLWESLNQAHLLIYAQELELGDLREAVTFLADTVQGLQDRLAIQEKGTLE